MNSKIESYINTIFADIPKSVKAIELKEELMSNLSDRYEDYLREGKSESESYGLAIASMGDIDDLIAEVMPGEEIRYQLQSYKRKKARNTVIALIFYFIAAMVFFGLLISDTATDKQVALGLVIPIAICIFPTILLVYTSMTAPEGYVKSSDDDDEVKFKNSNLQVVYNGLSGIYWVGVTAVYLIVSFYFVSWTFSWIIWIIAAAMWAGFKFILMLIDMNQN